MRAWNKNRKKLNDANANTASPSIIQPAMTEAAPVIKDLESEIPILVKDCLNWLESHPEGTTSEGIFRVSGDYNQIQYIYNKYERPSQFTPPPQTSSTNYFRWSYKNRTSTTTQHHSHSTPLVDLQKLLAENMDCVHSVAGVLKKYIRELPIPLLTFEFYDCFIAIMSISDEIHRLDPTRTVLSLLPSGNKIVLQRLLRYLQQIALNEKTTKMNASNLAIVFAPSILRPEGTSKEHSLSLQITEGGDAANLVRMMISHYNYIFENKNTVNQEDIAKQLSKASNIDDPNKEFYSTLKAGTIRLAAALLRDENNSENGSIGIKDKELGGSGAVENQSVKSVMNADFFTQPTKEEVTVRKSLANRTPPPLPPQRRGERVGVNLNVPPNRRPPEPPKGGGIGKRRSVDVEVVVEEEEEEEGSYGESNRDSLEVLSFLDLDLIDGRC